MNSKCHLTGMCSLDEFHSVMRHFGLFVPPAAIDELFAQFDADGSGEIDYAEMQQALRNPPPSRSSEQDGSQRADGRPDSAGPGNAHSFLPQFCIR